ncbi:MAG TPA: hypothetical protein VFU37_18000, partial [Pyrinomonadaceae bacterium]|nr:hypothetical protein [Pyrinomonadaceae bacterium]
MLFTLLFPLFAEFVGGSDAIVNPFDFPINNGADIPQQSFLQVAQSMGNISWQNGVGDVTNLTETVANCLGYGTNALAGFFHDSLRTSTLAAPEFQHIGAA